MAEQGTDGGGGRHTHVLSVTSGKGGVGKSNLVLNVGISLARRKRKVLLLDADMGLANMDILLGRVFKHNLSHVLTGEKKLSEVIKEGPEGIHLLPAASGLEWMTELSQEQKLSFMQKMDALNGLYDILLIDTGAGLSSNVVYFNLAAQTRILLVTPEPTSLTDAYAVIKVLHANYGQKRFEVVVNFVSSAKEGAEVYRNLATVADRFLDVQLGYLGHISRDSHLGKAVLNRRPVVEIFPEASVTEDYRELARRITQMRAEAQGNDLGMFWRSVLETSPA